MTPSHSFGLDDQTLDITTEATVVQHCWYKCTTPAKAVGTIIWTTLLIRYVGVNSGTPAVPVI